MSSPTTNKVLISSHHPIYHSGFAKQARGISETLQKHNFKVAHVDIAGFKPGEDVKYSTPIYSEQKTYMKNRGKSAFIKALDEFKPDVVITIGDVWDHFHLPDTSKKRGIRWIAYIPVEQAPIMPASPIGVVEELRGHKFSVKRYLREPDMIVAYNQFGEEEIKKVLPPNMHNRVIHIHHGVNTDDFHVKEGITKSKVMGSEIIPSEDVFIASTVCRNNERKALDLMLIGWKKFVDRLGLEDQKNVRLYLHVPDAPEGYDIENIIALMNCRKTILRNKNITEVHGITEDKLADILNISDLYLNTSRAEGFGIPIIEALACGVPSLVPSYAGPGSIADTVNNKNVIRKIKTTATRIDRHTSTYWKDIDTDSLANNLMNRFFSLKNDNNRLNNKKRIEKIANKLFSWKVIGKQWVSVVETTLKQRRKIHIVKI